MNKEQIRNPHLIYPGYVLLLDRERGQLTIAQPGGTGARESEQVGGPQESGAPTTEAPTGDAAAGKQVFESAGCVACHTLADAGSTGTVGPNLDDAKPPATLVVTRVTDGAGAMPSFKDKLTEQQIQDVAAYVSSAAGTS